MLVGNTGVNTHARAYTYTDMHTHTTHTHAHAQSAGERQVIKSPIRV